MNIKNFVIGAILIFAAAIIFLQIDSAWTDGTNAKTWNTILPIAGTLVVIAAVYVFYKGKSNS